MNHNNHIDQKNHSSDNGIISQIGVNASSLVQNVFIPMTDEYLPIRNFLDAHSIDSYGWIFTGDNQNGKIQKRNP